MDEQAVARAFRLAHFEKLGSTNDEALARARAGDPGRLWIVADEQSGGRGRLGRTWSSPAGNLYASLLLLDPAPPLHLSELGFVAGVALAESVRALVDADPRLGIKWPNDLLFAEAKLGGILLESTPLPGGGRACVIGIGVNCRSHPDNTPYPATALVKIGDAALAEKPIGPEHVFRALSASLARWLEVWAGGKEFGQIRVEWLKYAAHIGRTIQIVRPNGRIEGIFKSIDAQGRLILTGPQGEKVIEAGDVFLNAPPSDDSKAM
ncbi:biotin--[acetyl-CoA-carboxylase] ligase [Beijerinckia indica]|uniref:biotin--[biotin carboxyl-carrier protein] ligase n=1 Tax=Beijerinckia indica subsp. indica (strain ATCC 9039 / DSM 1715 / NCIMB 8712) TaxID=395963 RepID=B2IHV2_BEII9|nr:biotin--[acetyl-CoA-carboxylase] ligase [Beijerinckia indica]ACB95995.1 biotin--acetyl-CoA-carboxylase ligase [Beijerinckia indica subsp. indica ATCC 9039]